MDDLLNVIRKDIPMDASESAGSWIKLNPLEGPVDGINMNQVTSFICQDDTIMLYIGWVPEGKTPWLTLRGENARQVMHWLARRELIYI